MTPGTQEFDFSGTYEQKVERLIFYATRHSVTLSTHGTELHEIRRLLRELDEDRQRREVEDGRRDERDKALLDRLKSVEKALEGLKGVLNKAIAVIASAMALALLNWMLSGGLKIAGAALKATGGP